MMTFKRTASFSSDVPHAHVLSSHASTGQRYGHAGLSTVEAACCTRMPFQVPHAGGVDAQERHEQAFESLVLPGETTARLTRLSRIECVGLAGVPLAAWSLALAAHHAQAEVLLGHSFDNPWPEPDGSLRPAVRRIDPLTLCLKIPGQCRLGDWLRDIQRQQLDHEARARLTLVEVRRSEAPSLRSLVVIRDPACGTASWYGSPAPHAASLRGTVPCSIPLLLLVTPGERLGLELHYRRTQFNAAAVQALMYRFGFLLAGFACGGAQTLSRLSSLADSQCKEPPPWARCCDPC